MNYEELSDEMKNAVDTIKLKYNPAIFQFVEISLKKSNNEEDFAVIFTDYMDDFKDEIFASDALVYDVVSL